MMEDFCLQTKQSQKSEIGKNKENSVTELTGMLEDPIKPTM